MNRYLVTKRYRRPDGTWPKHADISVHAIGLKHAKLVAQADVLHRSKNLSLERGHAVYTGRRNTPCGTKYYEYYIEYEGKVSERRR